MHHDLIFDIGMNDGADTAYYLHRGYRVVAVEANPQLVDAARSRFKREIAAGRLTVLGVAVAAAPGVLPFWICDSHSHWSSFDHEIASRDGSACHQIDVECRPFRDILDDHGVPYFLKIDIEGTDHLCIGDLTPNDLPNYLSFERIGRPDDLLRLSELGYSGFKCISQFAFLPIEWPPAAEERAYGTLTALLKSDRPIGDIARALPKQPRGSPGMRASGVR